MVNTLTKIPTFASLPSAQAFLLKPDPQLARQLTKEALKAVERLDGQAGPLLVETIRGLSWSQFHPQRAELVKAYLEHSHTEPNRKQAIELYIENAKMAYYDGNLVMTTHYAELAVDLALANGWFDKAFKAGESIAGFGLNYQNKKFFAKLAEVAREIGDSTRARKYESWADPSL